MSYQPITQQAKSRSIENRFKRFGIILLSLFFLYTILNHYLDIKMILVNYALYPLVILALLFLLLINCKNNNNTQITNVIKSNNSVFNVNYLISIGTIFFLLVLISVSIALLPALFLSETLNLTQNDNLELAKVISHYYGRLWLMTPWPVVILYIGFFGALAQKYGIYDIKTFVHSIYKSKFEHDSVHNLLMILYYLPKIFIISLVTVIAIYTGYFAIVNSLGLTAIQGVNFYTLLFCGISIIIASRKKIKDIFRSYDYHHWSIFKLLIISTLSLVLWLLIPTIVFNITSFDSFALLQGSYNFYNYDIKLQYLFFIWVLWWFCMPVLGYVCYQILQNYSYKQGMFVYLLATVITYSCLSLIKNNDYIFSSIVYLLNSPILKPGALVIIINSFLYYAFNNQKEHYLFTMDLISKENSVQKNRSASRAYYYLFIILNLLLVAVILENVFILYKILSFFSIINLLLLLYFMVGLRRLTSLK